MRLFEVPRNTRVQLTGTPELVVTFHHLDGMYSYCTDDDGHVWHLAAYTEVEIVDEPEILDWTDAQQP